MTTQTQTTVPDAPVDSPTRSLIDVEFADLAGVADALDAAADADAKLAELTSLIDALTGEIDLLRRRDAQIQTNFRRMDEEMRLAARVQRDFLPRSLPRVGPVTVDVLFEPAGYVSGDFYDVRRLDEHNLGLYLVDAVGHGTPAALLTMYMKNALRTKVITGKRYDLVAPSQAMVGLNEALLDADLELASFATGIYGRLDCKNLTWTFARGGHPHPVLLRDGTATDLHADGGLLGIMAEETFPEVTVPLQPGDRLVLFSDGVEVAFSPDGVGDLRHWRRFIADRAALPTLELMNECRRTSAENNGSLAARDDLTVLIADIAA